MDKRLNLNPNQLVRDLGSIQNTLPVHEMVQRNVIEDRENHNVSLRFF
jgi:hypothetical protein